MGRCLLTLDVESELAPGLMLADASGVLPARRVPKRAVSRIRRIYVRHTGVPGRPGLAGAEVHTALALRAYRAACAPGHYWLPTKPIIGPDSQTGVLRLAPDDWRAPHSGGRADTHGLGILVQGDLDRQPLSPLQQQGLSALLAFLRKRYGRQLDADWLSWARAPVAVGKRASSGRYLVAWLQEYLEAEADERDDFASVDEPVFAP